MPITPSCQSSSARTYERLAAGRSGLQRHGQLLAQRGLADEVLEPARTQRAVEVLVREDVPAPPALRLRPLLHPGDGRPQNSVLDLLPFAVQLLELVGEPAGSVGVFGEQQLERRLRAAEAARGVDPRRQPEADGALVDACGIDAGGLHQGSQAGLLGSRQSAEPGLRQRAVLVNQRHDIGDRRQSDEVEMARQHVAIRPEQCLAQLVDDTCAAELRERVVGGTRGDDRAVGQLLARPVVVGDHDVDSERPRMSDLIDRGDPAVDGEHEPASVLCELRQRLPAEAVALLEAARQMPRHVCAQLAQDEDGQRSGADAVGVVVAVHADPLAVGNGLPNRLAGLAHAPEQERVVTGQSALEEGARLLRIPVPAPDEDASSRLADPERSRQLARVPVQARTYRPSAVVHWMDEGTEGIGRSRAYPWSNDGRSQLQLRRGLRDRVPSL